MLLASKISVYVKSVHKAIAGDRSAFPLAAPLGLTRSSAIAGLESFHASRIASGCTRVGRKMISCPQVSGDVGSEAASFGYLYEQDLMYSEGGTPILRAPRRNRLLLAPRLAVRVHGHFTAATSLEQFSARLDAIGLSFEILSIPFKEDSWIGEDVICSNGFGFKQVLGPMKGLSRASRKNFDEILAHSAFGFSCMNKNGSQLRGFAAGSGTQTTTLRSLYLACQDAYRITGDFPLCDGDLVELEPLCAPMTSSAGDEWIFSSAGISLNELRFRLVG